MKLLDQIGPRSENFNAEQFRAEYTAGRDEYLRKMREDDICSGSWFFIMEDAIRNCKGEVAPPAGNKIDI